MTNQKLYIDIDLLKRHLNLDAWFNGDDLYLAHLIMVCQEAVERAIDDKFSNLEDENGDIPSALAHAILLLCGTYYDDRESITHSNAVKIPHAFEYLLDLYRNYNPQNLKNNNNSNKCCCNE
jgi:uncharacterized phage protein (predicted DNA packaging)